MMVCYNSHFLANGGRGASGHIMWLMAQIGPTYGIPYDLPDMGLRTSRKWQLQPCRVGLTPENLRTKAGGAGGGSALSNLILLDLSAFSRLLRLFPARRVSDRGGLCHPDCAINKARTGMCILASLRVALPKQNFLLKRSPQPAAGNLAISACCAASFPLANRGLRTRVTLGCNLMKDRA